MPRTSRFDAKPVARFSNVSRPTLGQSMTVRSPSRFDMGSESPAPATPLVEDRSPPRLYESISPPWRAGHVYPGRDSPLNIDRVEEALHAANQERRDASHRVSQLPASSRPADPAYSVTAPH